MVTLLDAKRVLSETDEESEWVQFLVNESDDCPDSIEYFVVERAKKFDAQDVQLGMNTYYCELNGQAQSGYGLIRDFVLARDHAVVTLTSKVAEHLNTPHLRISFSLTDEDFGRIHVALGRVFDGCDCFHSVAN